MPLPMIHLATAREYAKDFSTLLNCPEFYLGSISPDAIHMRVNTERKDKNVTHLHAEGDSWKDNVLKFLKQSKTNPNYNFLLGYGIHILTDIIWHETIYIAFKRQYEKDSNPLQDIRWAYYNDTDQLDFELYEICEWRKNIWNLLKKSDRCSVEGILETDEIIAWKDRTLEWFNRGVSQHKNPIKYISLENLQRFIHDCANSIKTILESEDL